MAALRKHHPLAPYAFLAPAVLVLGVFFVGALVQVFYYSFTRYSAFDGPHWVGTQNYARLLSSDRFWRCLLNTGLYLFVTPALIVLSLLAAMAVDAKLRGMTWLRLALFLPVITPTIVAALAWRVLYNEEQGLLNTLLSSLGLGTVRWLSEYPWTLISAMVVTLWKGFGFYMMVFLAALLAVPRELKEAAAIDCAGRLGIFRNVVLPSIWPAIAMVLVLSSISALKVFDELYVTVKGAPITHQTVVPLVYQEAFERGDYGFASAIGITLFAIILVFSLINLRLTATREVR